MTQTHEAACRCARCRHERFRPGPPSSSRSARSALNFLGRFQYRPKLPRAWHKGGAGGFLTGGRQRQGPIVFQPASFLTAMNSTNKFLDAPSVTLRWVTKP